MNARSSRKALCCLWKSVRSQFTCSDPAGDCKPVGVADPDLMPGDSIREERGDVIGDACCDD